MKRRIGMWLFTAAVLALVVLLNWPIWTECRAFGHSRWYCLKVVTR